MVPLPYGPVTADDDASLSGTACLPPLAPPAPPSSTPLALPATPPSVTPPPSGAPCTALLPTRSSPKYNIGDLVPTYATFMEEGTLSRARPLFSSIQDTSAVLGHLAGKGGGARLSGLIAGKPVVPPPRPPRAPSVASVDDLVSKGKVGCASSALMASRAVPSVADVQAVLRRSFKSDSPAIPPPLPASGPSAVRQALGLGFEMALTDARAEMKSKAPDRWGTSPSLASDLPLDLLTTLADDALACRDSSPLSDVRLTLIQKASGGWRPIGVGCSLAVLIKKIAATHLNIVASPILVARGAYSLATDGCRRLVTGLRQGLDQGFHLVALDIEDAFCQVDRAAILARLSSDAPPIAPFIQHVLQPNSIAAQGGDGSFHMATCTRGVIQGCPLSSTLFSLLLSRLVADAVRARGGSLLTDANPFDADLVAASYADDIFLLSRSEDAAATVARDLAASLAQVGLSLARGKTRLLAVNPFPDPWVLLDTPVAPAPALKVLGIPVGRPAEASGLLLELIQEVGLFVAAVKTGVRLQAHRLLVLNESGPFARLQWVMAGVDPPVVTPAVLSASSALDRLVAVAILHPPAPLVGDPPDVPPFIPLDRLSVKALDTVCARLGHFVPLLRHLRPPLWHEPAHNKFALVHDPLVKSQDPLLPPFFGVEAASLKGLFHRDALREPDPSFPATLFAVSGLPGAFSSERVLCSSPSHAAGSQSMLPHHHLVCRCASTGRHNLIRDLLANFLRKIGNGAKVAVEQTAAGDGSAAPRAWGTRGSYAPGDVTFEAHGRPPVYLDIVVSLGSSHKNLSPAASAYHGKLAARHRFLHPRAPLSAHDARSRALLANIDYSPIAFSTLGSPAPSSVKVLKRLMGPDLTKEFLRAAARSIHMSQAFVVSSSRFAHRAGRQGPSQGPVIAVDESLDDSPLCDILDGDDAPESPCGVSQGPPSPSPTMPLTAPVPVPGPVPVPVPVPVAPSQRIVAASHAGSSGGIVPASRFFVPLIHAAHATHALALPPANITALIAAARLAYETWASGHPLVPSWDATVAAVRPPLAGWPPFNRAYISADTQERVLGLNNNVLPGPLYHIHDWVFAGPRPDGLRAATRDEAPPSNHVDRRYRQGHALNPLPVPD